MGAARLKSSSSRASSSHKNVATVAGTIMATVAKAVIQRGHFLLRDRSNRTNSADSKKTQKKPDSVAKMTVKKVYRGEFPFCPRRSFAFGTVIDKKGRCGRETLNRRYRAQSRERRRPRSSPREG